MKMWMTLSAALLAGSMLVTPAIAGEKHGKHHSSSASRQKAQTCPVMAYESAMETMHKGMNISYTGDTDVDFVVGMIPHHQGAVDMAKVVLEHGSDPDIRRLAKWIIQAQIVEIGQMTSWINGRTNAKAPVKDTAQVAQYKAAMDKMHKDMMIEYTGDADVDFARGMIPHHQGAIDMAEVELRYGKNKEIHTLASDIIYSQMQEIGIMQRWLDEHAPAAPAPKKKTSKKKSHH